MRHVMGDCVTALRPNSFQQAHHLFKAQTCMALLQQAQASSLEGQGTRPILASPYHRESEVVERGAVGGASKVEQVDGERGSKDGRVVWREGLVGVMPCSWSRSGFCYKETNGRCPQSLHNRKLGGCSIGRMEGLQGAWSLQKSPNGAPPQR